ncbi:MAG: SDR family NAD(P)-dependent oxidoreductase [Deinococcales bacterium]
MNTMVDNLDPKSFTTINPLEPLAIVGMGCRLPGGVKDAQSYWQLLGEGKDAVGEIPADRFNTAYYYDVQAGTPGKMTSKWGGFLESSLADFDAEFFGISPREATLMDPQQRLLLEVAYEAFEDASLSLEALSNSLTSVYIGISNYDYASMLHLSGARAVAIHSNTGGALSIAANRISYFFNLKGSSVSVDTACSSSLVAVHLAAQDIWRGSSHQALVGGVNRLLEPEPYVGFSQLSMLSPDGRCKAFDAKGNGYVRSEGAGLIVLKKLSQAEKDGDKIYALILATGSNQDGRTSSITIPSESAQAQLIRQTCQAAGIAAKDIHYAEAHGTGTPVGDPIEARALGSVLSEGRDKDKACKLGSVKSNIGHLEPASGIAGLIKVALALKERELPASLHFETPNPNIDFEALGLEVQSQKGPWPAWANMGEATACINSFGFGGTNAHAILREYIPAKQLPAPNEKNTLEIFTLSTHQDKALQVSAGQLARYLDHAQNHAQLSLKGLSYKLSQRSQLAKRLAILAKNKEDLQAKLSAFSQKDQAVLEGVFSGQRVHKPIEDITFICSGQGPQWWGMGQQLLKTEALFRQIIEQCDEVIRTLGDWSLLEELQKGEVSSRIAETAIAQPAIFALQVALAKLWESYGIKPKAVIGHSVGEVAAAYLAGALSLEEATKVIYFRGKTMDEAPTEGKMLAVGLPLEEALKLIEGKEDKVSLAAVNSPTSVTLSGVAEVIEEIAGGLEPQNIFHRILKINYAFHSPLINPVKEPLLKALADLKPIATSIPMISTVTGQEIQGEDLNADYWWRNAREGVFFAKGVETLMAKGHQHFIEIAPHPVLSPSLKEIFQAAGKSQDLNIVHSLERQKDEKETFLSALAKFYVAGAKFNFQDAAQRQGLAKQLPPLASYPWQPQSFWLESELSQQKRLNPSLHPLLGHKVAAAIPIWENTIDLKVERFLADHSLKHLPLLPATSYLEWALAAARERYGEGLHYQLDDVVISKACFLPSQEGITLQFSMNDAGFSLRSRRRSKSTSAEDEWTEHVRGRAYALELRESPRVDLAEVREGLGGRLEPPTIYHHLDEIGLNYGPAFRAIESIYVAKAQTSPEALAHIKLNEQMPPLKDFILHPALLDACLQAAVSIAPSDLEGVFLPVALKHLRAYKPLNDSIWAHIKLSKANLAQLEFDIQVCDDDGKILAELETLRCQNIDSSQQSQQNPLDKLVYAFTWQEMPLETSHQPLGQADFLNLARQSQVAITSLDQKLRASQNYADFEKAVSPLASLYIFKAFAKLGLKLEMGRSASLKNWQNELIELGVLEKYRPLIQRQLAILIEDGYLLKGVDDSYHVAREVNDEVLEETHQLWQGFFADYPEAFADLMLASRCGENLAELLRGKADPLAIMSPAGSMTISEQFYQDGPSFKFYNLAAQEGLKTLIDPLKQPLKILEIGAGTGGLSSYILPILPKNSHYIYSDISAHFFRRAEEKLRDYDFISYHRCDIENLSFDEVLEVHSFDIILAANVLHATQDLRHSLANIQKLLKPNAFLMLLELIRPPRFSDIIFGLTDGWWRFSDRDLRQDNPLIPATVWEDILKESGFRTINLTQKLAVTEPLCAVIVAQDQSQSEQPELSQPVIDDSAQEGHYLIFADQQQGAYLARELKALGASSELVFSGEKPWDSQETYLDIADQQAIARFISPRAKDLKGIVYLWGLEHPLTPHQSQTNEAILKHHTPQHLQALIYLTQSLVQQDSYPRLYLVSQKAESLDKELNDYGQAALWGLGRVIVSELPKFKTSMIDLGQADKLEIGQLAQEILASSAEDEVMLRQNKRYVHRFLPFERLDRQAERGSAYRLESKRLGLLDQLYLAERPRHHLERRHLGKGQIEIEIMAAALNFSDVLKAHGIYPGLDGGPIPFGIEGAGRVSAIAEDVTRFKVGDEVLAVVPFSMAKYAITNEALAVHKPAKMNFEAAATIPIAFLTADYALNYLGRMEADDKVLIHAATGGVGLAAIQLAKAAGAEIFVTAGSDEKRQLLADLGIKHIMNSRSLDFVDEVLELTKGEGVDLVLNSLAGEAINRGMRVLGHNGRFLEIGKRDIYQNRGVGLEPFQKNLSFHAIDLDSETRRRPKLLGKLLISLMKRFETGELSPLPYRSFPIDQVKGAFRYLSQAKHMGKVLVSMEGVNLRPEKSPAKVNFKAIKGSYLITGAFGGFGLKIATWLVAKGVKELALLSRQGAKTDEAREALRNFQDQGINILELKADVADKTSLAEAFRQIQQELSPLTGIFHAAMVLDDAVLMNLNPEKFNRVWQPKVLGAYHLHELSKGLDLKHFVLFFSLASVVGSAGQGNYAAANALLDALAHHRKAQGLAATAISWGYLSEVGAVSQREHVAKRFDTVGIQSFSPKEAVKLLERYLAEDEAHLGIMRLDWQRFKDKALQGQILPRFADLASAVLSESETVSNDANIQNLLAQSPAEKRPAIISQRLREMIAKVLGLSVEKIDAKRPLTELGIDSLMAVELSNRIENEFKLSLPTSQLLKGPSIEEMSQSLAKQLEPSTRQPKPCNKR